MVAPPTSFAALGELCPCKPAPRIERLGATRFLTIYALRALLSHATTPGRGCPRALLDDAILDNFIWRTQRDA